MASIRPIGALNEPSQCSYSGFLILGTEHLKIKAKVDFMGRVASGNETALISMLMPRNRDR